MLRLICPLLLLSLASPALAQQPPRPNIILIITDDQGYGDLSLHGNPHLKTPHIDALARQSVQFTQFIVSPVCAPTRASLLTGRYNYRTGAIDTYLGRAMMHVDELTLADSLKAAGYRTALAGKWHLGDCYPLRPQDQGFDEVLMHRGGGISRPSDPPLPGGSSYTNPILQHNGVEKPFKGYCTDVFTDHAISFIEQSNTAGQPFFLYLATNAPHTPLQVDPVLVKPFSDMGLDDTTARVYAMVQNIDANVGRVLAKLDELTLTDNTIVVYLHDNGPQQARRFNAKLRGLKGSVYEGGIRSPLFIRYPSKLKPAIVARLAAHIDITPTLLNLAGVQRGDGHPIDGRSLTPLLANPAADWPDRTLFIQWHRGDVPRPHENAAVRTERYKLVNGKELYDLQADPAESKDIAANHADVIQRLRRQYDDWFADVTRNRRFDPPYIILGTPHHNPVTLTRQDWRGPRAGWKDDSLGHWLVEFAEPGAYEFTLRFPAIKDAGEATLNTPDLHLRQPLKPGDKQCILTATITTRSRVPLEAAITTAGRPVGPHYVQVHRR